MQIEKAAIRQNGNIYTGRRHGEIIKDMVDNHGLPKPIIGEQGFINELGEFVDRLTAAKLALESGQIKELHWPPYLYSEDLY